MVYECIYNVSYPVPMRRRGWVYSEKDYEFILSPKRTLRTRFAMIYNPDFKDRFVGNIQRELKQIGLLGRVMDEGEFERRFGISIDELKAEWEWVAI